MISVPVRLPGREYEVVIGSGVSRLLPELLPDSVKQVAVVTQEGIGLEIDSGRAQATFEVPRGEGAKSMSTVEQLCRNFAASGLARSDAVVCVGGGVVSDLGGFAAGVYLRGISYVNVATTLLAQVDAAIGGKTGVNLEEGKNLVGVIWQPLAVLCDTDCLETLPRREWLSGRGEMAKCAFLGRILDPPPKRGSPEEIAWLHELSLEEQIARCVAIKAAVVSADEREGDQRMLLNYGHTLAHALEGAALAPGGDPDVSHGEAVAIGLIFAARLARRLGRIDEERVRLHSEVLNGLELPTEIPPGRSADELLQFMARDKKARHDFTFVLDGPVGVDVVKGVPRQDILDTLAEMGCPP